MKKLLFSLALLVSLGASLSFASPYDNWNIPYNRTIPLHNGVAPGANTLIVGRGGVLRYVNGYASSANATYYIMDANSINNALGYSQNGSTPQQNVLAEGGQATQYNNLTLIDFGDEGLNFVNGIVVITTTATVNVYYY